MIKEVWGEGVRDRRKAVSSDIAILLKWKGYSGNAGWRRHRKLYEFYEFASQKSMLQKYKHIVL